MLNCNRQIVNKAVKLLTREANPVDIMVCIGSGCHLKGSEQIQDKIINYIKEHGLEDEIKIKASFCRGHCSEGVSMSIDGEEILNASPENIEGILKQHLKGGVYERHNSN